MPQMRFLSFEVLNKYELHQERDQRRPVIACWAFRKPTFRSISSESDWLDVKRSQAENGDRFFTQGIGWDESSNHAVEIEREAIRREKIKQIRTQQEN